MGTRESRRERTSAHLTFVRPRHHVSTASLRRRCTGIFPFFLPRRRSERGFTLIELLIVVAVIGVLVAILIPNFMRSRTQAQIAASKTNIKAIATALESYFVEKQTYPTDPTLGVLVAGSFIRWIPPDPCTNSAYVYTPSGTPPFAYTLATPSWTTTACTIVANGLQYTPTGGLVQL